MSDWIAKAIKHKGALHIAMHIPKDKKIPEKRLVKAAHGKGVNAKRARLAITLKKIAKKRSK